MTTWIGGFPKIGIRPTIDGRRRGVRESLEKQGHGPWPRPHPGFLSSKPQISQRQAGGMRHR